MEEARHLYKIQDFFRKQGEGAGSASGPEQKQAALSLRKRLEDATPRTRLLAPPHLPVKKYLFLGPQRKAKYKELQAVHGLQSAQEDSGNDPRRPPVFARQATEIPGVHLELLQPPHISKYPKPAIKLQLSPYPNPSTDTLERPAATIISPTAVAGGQHPLGWPAKKGNTIMSGMKSQNVVKIISKDQKWQERNLSRVAASIRKNRIPHLKYFTSEYDNERVHQHDFQKQLEEQFSRRMHRRQESRTWRQRRRSADGDGANHRDKKGQRGQVGVENAARSHASPEHAEAADAEAFLADLLEKAESKDGYKFDIDKFRKESRRASEGGGLISPTSDMIERGKPTKTDTLGMIRIMEEKSVDLENMEEQRSGAPPYAQAGHEEANVDEDFADDSSMDIEQLHRQIEMFSKNIDELRDYTKRMTVDDAYPGDTQTFVTQGPAEHQELHKSNTFNPLTQNINRYKYQLNYFSSGGVNPSLPATQQNWLASRDGATMQATKTATLQRTSSIQNTSSTKTGGMNTLLQIRKQQQANYLRNDGLQKDSLQSELKDALQRHHFHKVQSAKTRAGRSTRGARHFPQKAMKLRKGTAELTRKQNGGWTKKNSQGGAENLSGKDAGLGNSNRVISEALKKNCINLQGMKIQEMVQKQQQILSMNNDFENEHQYAAKSRSLASVSGSAPGVASQQEGTFHKDPTQFTESYASKAQGLMYRRPQSGAYLMSINNRNKTQYITCSSLPADYDAKACPRKLSSSRMNEQQDDNLLQHLQLHVNEGKASPNVQRMGPLQDAGPQPASNPSEQMSKRADQGGAVVGNSEGLKQPLNLMGQSMKLLGNGKDARMSKSVEMQMKAIHTLQAISRGEGGGEPGGDLSAQLRGSGEDPASVHQSMKKLNFQSFDARHQEQQQTSLRKDVQNGMNDQTGLSYSPTHELVTQQCQMKNASAMSHIEGSDEGEDSGRDKLIVQERIVLLGANGSSRMMQGRKASQPVDQRSMSAENKSNSQERPRAATVLRDHQDGAAASNGQKNVARRDSQPQAAKQDAGKTQELTRDSQALEAQASKDATNSDPQSGLIKVEVHKVHGSNGGTNRSGPIAKSKGKSPEGEPCHSPAKAQRSLVLSKSKQQLNESQQFQLIIQAHEFNQDHSETTANNPKDEVQVEGPNKISKDADGKRAERSAEGRLEQPLGRMIESVYVLRKTGPPQAEEALQLELKELEEARLKLASKKQRDAATNQATFYERKAFVDDFRRKWREDRGMVSLFDKRHKYREANQRVKSAAAFRAIGATKGARRLSSNHVSKNDRNKQKMKASKGICIKGSQANIDSTLSAATAAMRYKLKRDEKAGQRAGLAQHYQEAEANQDAQRIAAHAGQLQIGAESALDESQGGPYDREVRQDLDTRIVDAPVEDSAAARELSAKSKARRVAKLQRKHMHQILDLQEQQSSPIVLGIASFGSQRSQKTQESGTGGAAGAEGHTGTMQGQRGGSQAPKIVTDLDQNAQGPTEASHEQMQSTRRALPPESHPAESTSPVHLQRGKKAQRQTPQLPTYDMEEGQPDQSVKQSKTQTRLDEPLSALSPSHGDFASPHHMQMMSDTAMTAELQTQHQDTQVLEHKSAMLKVDEHEEADGVQEEEEAQAQAPKESANSEQVPEDQATGSAAARDGKQEKQPFILDQIVEIEEH